jgi:DNA-binding HxlR family transcriptional regulator
MEKKKNEIKKHGANECPITATIDVVGGKWKPPIIWLLFKGPMRFGELSKTMPDIALKVLSKQLKELERDGIIARKAYPEVPPRVEYSLTEKGTSLQPALTLLSAWSETYILSKK